MREDTAHGALTPPQRKRTLSFRAVASPRSLWKGWGEGAFPRIDAQSCYDVWCVLSFETFSKTRPDHCGVERSYLR